MTAQAGLDEVAATWNAVRSTPRRIEKRERLAMLLARLEPEDASLAACFLAGETRQGALQIGGHTLAAVLVPAGEALPLFRDAPPDVSGPLWLADVDACFDAVQSASGPGAERRRIGLLRSLFDRATPAEREFLAALLGGEMRQGALRALVLEAVAGARGVPLEALRRAVMFAGDFVTVVREVSRDPAAALARFQPSPFVPIEPMLAATAESVADALGALGEAVVEWKLDGVRAQVHRDGGEVRVFSRQLRDVTPLAADIADLARGFAADRFILDGEIVARGAGGRPLPFQDLVSRFANESVALERREGAADALDFLAFDLLWLEGVSLFDEPYRIRRAQLEAIVPAAHRVTVLADPAPDAAERFYQDALARGHEGVLVKATASPYFAGRRGSQWLKVKPAITLDLVVLAAEWGHGRRRGWLSNLHLGARASGEPGRFVMLGKTFKGLTDTMLREQTEDLLQIETHRDATTVHVRPERVVEIAFDAVQRSSRYDSGFALRFARVRRYRPDKSAAEATTLDTVQRLHENRLAPP